MLEIPMENIMKKFTNRENKKIRKKWATALAASVLTLIMLFLAALPGHFLGSAGNILATEAEASVVSGDEEMRGVWLAMVDFKKLGLKNQDQTGFRKNTIRFLRTAKKNKINTVFLHVRSFDDALWKSKTFKASKFLLGKEAAKQKAYQAYSYDPLKIFIKQAHKRGIELHAWMNPYRVSRAYYLDPSISSTITRIKKAVREVCAYNIDGIHFDDYFYNAQRGYMATSNRKNKYTVSISAATKRANVNTMVQEVYKLTHKLGKNLVFGISPQGNYDNDMACGADVVTWMSKSGYVDYIVPQIYWTDSWGASGNVSMFSDRLNLFSSLRKSSVKMYVGLALYYAGTGSSSDPGWKKSSTNLKEQVEKLRAKNANGYILFSAKGLYTKARQKELANLVSIVR